MRTCLINDQGIQRLHIFSFLLTVDTQTFLEASHRIYRCLDIFDDLCIWWSQKSSSWYDQNSSRLTISRLFIRLHIALLPRCSFVDSCSWTWRGCNPPLDFCLRLLESCLRCLRVGLLHLWFKQNLLIPDWFSGQIRSMWSHKQVYVGTLYVSTINTCRSFVSSRSAITGKHFVVKKPLMRSAAPRFSRDTTSCRWISVFSQPVCRVHMMLSGDGSRFRAKESMALHHAAQLKFKFVRCRIGIVPSCWHRATQSYLVWCSLI